MILLIFFFTAYLQLVIFSRRPAKAPQMNLTLFWSYREAFDGLQVVRKALARQILMNILVCIPLGMILAALFHPSFLKPMLTGFAVSAATELTQYLTRRGLFEFDDIFNNTTGLLLGILIYRLALWALQKVKSSERQQTGKATDIKAKNRRLFR